MTAQEKNNFFGKIPPTYRILEIIKDAPWAKGSTHHKLVEAIHFVTNEIRQKHKTTETTEKEMTEKEMLEEQIIKALEKVISGQKTLNLRHVINATGIILHTNLGRAPLAKEASFAIEETSLGYCNLEMDLESGERFDRHSHVINILTNLTKAESALVVNNDAGAVLLILDTFAKGKEVIVSRGELIEIGGSFRLPEIMEKSSATLVEVGTTNRTYLSDYEDAITSNTALLFKAHTSNYSIIGFTSSPSPKELALLGKAKGVLTVYDMGNGLLMDLSCFGIEKEPIVEEQISLGMDLVAFSGDKLLGGPQAGIIAGKDFYIKKLAKNPLARALRPDKLHLAALETTLKYYEDERWKELPIYQMLSLKENVLKQKAKKLANDLHAAIGKYASVELWPGNSEVGGGTLPAITLPTWLVVVFPKTISVENLSQKLRLGTPSLVGRIIKDHLALDPRTIYKEDCSIITSLFLTAFENESTCRCISC